MRLEFIELLKSYGYPVYLQGSLPKEQAYPDSFITFWNHTTTPNFYDDGVATKVYGFYVYFYSNDPLLVLTMIEKIANDLRNNNYMVSGETDAQSDEITHTGQMIEVYYIKKSSA